MTRSRRSLAPATDTPMTDHARAVAAKAQVATPSPLASFRTVTGPGYKLIHGDCLEVLAAMADKSVHVTLTDPPYEAEAHEDGRRQNPTRDLEVRVVDGGLPFAAISDLDRVTVAALMARVTQHRALAFCQAEAIAAWRDAFNAADFPYRRAIPWNKPDAMPSLHGRWPGQAYETIALAQFPSAPPPPVGGASRRYDRVRAQFGRSSGGHGGPVAPHPTTKPLLLMLDMVADFTDPGDIVLDPFMGSGTTGVACIRLGRTFIGIEKDADYFEIACRRLAGDEAVPRECQPSLFDVRNAP